MLIAVTLIKGRSGFERDGSFSTKKGDRWQMFDVGAACQTFCLAAKDKGLGTVIMGIFDEDGITELLHIPEDQELAALIAIGWPDIDPEAPKRKTVGICFNTDKIKRRISAAKEVIYETFDESAGFFSGRT